MPTISPSLVFQLTLLVVVFFSLQISAAVLVYFERKISGWAQQRVGPNRVGPLGLLQPLADIVKLIFKEELRPRAADKWLFYLAPVLSATTAFAAFAVIPFGPPTTFFGLLEKAVPLQVADLNVAVLVVFAITSMGIYGIVLAGWASNSKYSLLGGLRSAAQMISYELAYGLALASVLVIANIAVAARDRRQAGRRVVAVRRDSGAGLVRVPGAGRLLHLLDRGDRRDQPRALRLPRGRAGAGGRLPHRVQLDVVRAVLPGRVREHGRRLRRDGEPVPRRVGYLPGLPDWLGLLWFVLKLAVLLFFYIWMRWTLPRYRYDQLMDFGWKVLLPLSVVNLLVTAAGVLYWS